MKEGDELIHNFGVTHYCEGNSNGLTKREHFAILAMQGLLANSVRSAGSLLDIFESSVALADDLIEELNKKNNRRVKQKKLKK